MTKKYVFTDWTNVEPGYGTSWLDESHPLTVPSGISLRAHRPVIENAPCLTPEMPWESDCLNGYGTLIREGDKLRLWYESFGAREGYDDMESFLCYAESLDGGKTFVRPKLGLVEFGGSKENNILMHAHGTCVLRDPDAPAEERYKLVRVRYDPKDPNRHWCRIIGSVSPDGISFTDLPEPILDNPSDTQNTLAIDPATGEYVLVTRQPYDYPSGRRSISMSRSRDFRHFPPAVTLVNNDPLDPPDWDYYTSGFRFWPGAESGALMLVDMFERVEDAFDVHLFSSSDARIWVRPCGREPWIPRGEEGEWNDKMVFALNGTVDLGEGRWAVMINGTRRGHNDSRAEYPWRARGQYRLASFREDGFLSIRAYAKGEFFTVALPCSGEKAEVNASLPVEGYVRVGLYDPAEEKFVPGFAPEDSDPLERGKVWQTVSWRGKSDLSAFGGKKLALRFEMFKSDLYAFRF
ncbi:MAG: hypothetical protein J5849_04355 [Clostridia bacterium]|nr:hypothetical protein [Clostridia bacterium]